MKIYFDMNIYNRVFDDQTQMRIRFETMAIDIIFELIEKEKYELVWSFILEFENSMNPYNNRKTYIKTLSTLAKYTIEPSEEIRKLAKSIMAKSNAKEKDALHLASSVYGKCDYFITCDDKLIATIIGNRLDKEIIEKGSKALIRELGYSGFLRFIRQIDEYGNEDYLEIEKEIFEDMSLDHIYDSATKYWENKKA